MALEPPNFHSRDRSQGESPFWVAAGVVVLIILFVAALGFPVFACQTWGIWSGVVLGIVIPVVWMTLLPNSCMNGGLGFALLAMVQCVAALAWLVVGIVTGIGLLF